jgi:hypothetical protein
MKLSSVDENISGSISTFLIKTLYGHPYISTHTLFQFWKIASFVIYLLNLVVRYFKFATK